MPFLRSDLEYVMFLLACAVIAFIGGAILFGYGVAELLYVLWEVLFAKKEN